MPFRLPYWWNATSTLTSISTPIPTTTSTIISTKPSTHITHAPHPFFTNPRFPTASPHYYLTVDLLITSFIQALSILAVWYFWRWRRASHNVTKTSETGANEERGEEVDVVLSKEAYLTPWLTKNWDVFYGLLWLSHEQKWSHSHTPFRPCFNNSIQDRWHDHKPSSKSSLAHLLEKGIIPLSLQRGGVHTTQQRTWSLLSSFPFIRLPRYTQAKSRGYFEFLVPYPRRGSTRTFLQSLMDNEEGYSVTLRFSTPHPNNSIAYEEMSTPRIEEQRLPSSVGAQAPFEVMLPFLRDQVLEPNLGMRARHLDVFVEGDDAKAVVPLVYWARYAVVRVEKGDYARCEVEEWVWGVARERVEETRWPRGVVVEAARRELRRQGLLVKGR